MTAVAAGGRAATIIELHSDLPPEATLADFRRSLAAGGRRRRPLLPRRMTGRTGGKGR